MMQSKLVKIFVAFLIITTVFSCTEEISVDVAHEPQTVIFGELTNQNLPITISIQQSLPLNSSESFNSVNNAIISLYQKDTNGVADLITNDFSVHQGTYISNQSITTVVGNTYWIEVVLADGTQFKSTEEVMLPIVPILEITQDDQFDDVLNVKFNDPGAATNFYKIIVNLFNQGQPVSRNFSESNDVIFNGNADASVDIDLFPIEDDEEFFVPEYDTIEVSLGNINFSSYQFLLNQRVQIEANEDAGDSSSGPSQLFSTPPVSLLGNITNTTTNKTALGNFTINSLSIENQ